MTANGNANLPNNILESLNKVVGSEGRLTFERLCTGLKIAILRHEADKNKFQEQFNSEEEINRTNSLPNIFDPNPDEQLRYPPPGFEAPSPVPSEPILYNPGPPKPPRDPVMRISATNLKRRDSHSRRHTLQGGVDVSMVSNYNV